ncbi:MAG: alpha/beta hydrolase [Proteobacteria bacterium]|nr:alpha/beta hydrolase [Pseudomonadota bacterium]
MFLLGNISKKFIQVGSARVAFFEKGEGRPIVFIHGLPTSSFLWRGVMETARSKFKCLAPDLLGMGDTEVAPDQDFSMPAQAEMIRGFLDALKIPRAAIVAHDQGGACAQIFATRFPRMVSHLILVDSVAYDSWPVFEVRRMQRWLKIPPAVWALNLALRIDRIKVVKFMFRKLVFNQAVLSEEVMAEYSRTIGADPERRERFRRFVLAGDGQYTLAAAPLLAKFDRPTMIVWGAEDKVLPVSWGERLYREIPGARRFELVPGAGHLVPEEKPEVLGRLIIDFLSSI